MSKLCLMGKNALKSRVPPLNPTRIRPSFQNFSTEGGEQQQDSSSSAYPLFQSPEGISFSRLGMLQFPSQSDFDSAFRITVRKGRLYRLEKVERSQWEILPSSDGKSVLLQGIPRNALPEDVKHFLAGSNFEPDFQLFARPIGFNGLTRCAIVRFPTPIDAMSAYLTKNNGFCRNTLVTMKVLQ